MTPDHWLKLAALVGAAVAFFVGLAQYRKAQQWRRAEWVAQEMKSLFDDQLVQAAFLMIDWGSRRIPLYPLREKDEDRYILLTNEAVATALMDHHDRRDGFTTVEADIRVAFDRALDGLERFHSYVSTRLVQRKDLAPYLRYWALTLYDPQSPRSPEHRVSRLVQYMGLYGYEGAASLLKQIAEENPRMA